MLELLEIDKARRNVPQMILAKRQGFKVCKIAHLPRQLRQPILLQVEHGEILEFSNFWREFCEVIAGDVKEEKVREAPDCRRKKAKMREGKYEDAGIVRLCESLLESECSTRQYLPDVVRVEESLRTDRIL